ncbi:hypothetical protein GCM10025857_68230 [Alicyclobacillus contaminans]|uniref:helix-turn-helix domain-containing protein n=1 Tax=Alicyclobacillus contaminans TaxID=392016 RepID=UPI00047EF9BF|nr:helix-turn-helix transcriptional regulator [Alicyclobacillus contaminans]GMA50186.1 hypothetical protein GCM10025857_15430 [Alicyclobacillus contaminans]GMA52010.1 hypothetical protein GCM10025857_33670 [Alicyclobacillus contaminans]GMA55442.1 hypothetical protein GCM10025857_67990 [Alicyclobacillus contaminans]GMA55466.1 hypothetical protein GCM10025857_68230 [Alicyclobacillus contaminans]
MNPFGAKLRALRNRKGLTQKQIADQLGMTVRGYQYYETGNRYPDLKKACRLAEILDVTLDELSVRDCTPNGESA